ADCHQHSACKKRYTPRPGGKLSRSNDRGGNQENKVGEDDTRRQPERHKTTEQATSVVRGVFDRHQNSTSPLPSEREALHKTKYHEQHGCPHTKACVARQEPDSECRTTHQEQTPDQC